MGEGGGRKLPNLASADIWMTPKDPPGPSGAIFAFLKSILGDL